MQVNFPQDQKPWVKAVSTDVMATFKRLGFVPPSEQPEYHAKWNYYKSLGAQ
jgi:hypothetical protein